MNNHWSTNYRAYQDGLLEFRCALRPHGRHRNAAASRFAIGMSQPLVSSATEQRVPMGLKLHIDRDDVLVQHCKRSSDGRGWIVRFFGASDERRAVNLSWTGDPRVKVWRSDLREQKLEQRGTRMDVPGWELVSLRIET